MAPQRSRRFVYWASCVELSSGELVNAIRWHPKAEQITYRAFARQADLAPLRAQGHPAMRRMSWPGNSFVSFHRSFLPDGSRVYYFAWSGIEHFFVDQSRGRPSESALVAMLEREQNPDADQLPVRPENMLLVRVRDEGVLDPSYLYVVLSYLRTCGLFEALAHGAAQQCVRGRDIAAISVADGGKLGDLVVIKTRFSEDELRPGDILLQRVGTTKTCGRASLVTGVGPLSLRTDNPAGGLAAGKRPADFDPEQLAAGTRVELEHTSDPKIAQKIAMDHLVEHPRYYEALAAMEAQLEESRRAGNPQVTRRARHRPSDDDWNVYITFVLYAVLGRTSAADVILGQYPHSVERVARVMRARGPMPRGTLYRGVLLEPRLVVNGVVAREHERRFESYSADRDVACWFADPRSVVSGYVAQERPEVGPYLTTVEAARAADRVIWWSRWTAVPVGEREFGFFDAAALHPDIDAGQWAWNARTQSEVILSAGTSDRIHVAPVGPDECPPIAVLDARYTWPPALLGITR